MFKLNYIDKQTLDNKSINLLPFLLLDIGLTLVISYFSYNAGYNNGTEYSMSQLNPQEREIIIADIETSEFTQEALVEFMIETNIKYPHIVLAQAILETGNFKSEIFKMNHNLFGMKQPILRPTTALGTNLNHAYYNNWKESVYDYALYQAAYLKNAKTEKQYLQYLGSNYAEANHYVKALNKIIKKNKLDEVFINV